MLSYFEIPKVDRPNWSVEDINRELENNAQGILVMLLDGSIKVLRSVFQILIISDYAR